MNTSDMRIYIPKSGRYVFADASVVCGRSEFKDDQRDTLLNPRVIIEVLSPSSEEYDRGDKFAQYRTLPSVKHYVLAAQDKPHLEVHTWQTDGSWSLREYGPGEQVDLPAIECMLEVDRIYANVFEPDDGA